MLMYLAIDPGYRNGLAYFGDDGTLYRRLVLIEDDFLKFLNLPLPGNTETIICENFRIFPNMGQRLLLNTMVAARMIGAVQLAAKRDGIPLVLQEPQGMRQAAANLGYKYSTKSHIPDQISAHAHGTKWLIATGVITLAKARKDKEEYEGRNSSKAQARKT